MANVNQVIDVAKDATFLTKLAQQLPAYTTELLKIVINYIQVGKQAIENEKALQEKVASFHRLAEDNLGLLDKIATQRETIARYQKSEASLRETVYKMTDELANVKQSNSLLRTVTELNAKTIAELKTQHKADAAKLADYTVELSNTAPLTVGVLIDSHRVRGQMIKTFSDALDHKENVIQGLRQANNILVTNNADMAQRLEKVKGALK